METGLSIKDPQTRNLIRTLWLEGKEVGEIQKELSIPKGTWDTNYYCNHNAFRDFIQNVKAEYFIRCAEKTSKEVNEIVAGDNAKLLAIKQKEAEFLRETLGKDLGYSKRPDSLIVNVNKNEPLTAEQKQQLDNLIRGGVVKVIEGSKDVDKQGDGESSNISTQQNEAV